MPIGSIVVPFGGLWLRSYKVFPKGTTMQPMGKYKDPISILSDRFLSWGSNGLDNGTSRPSGLDCPSKRSGEATTGNPPKRSPQS